MSELVKRVAGEAEELGRTALGRLGHAARRDGGEDAPVARGAITIGRSAEELQPVLTDPRTLARVLEREVRVVEDRPGEGPRWRSPDGAEHPFELSTETVNDPSLVNPRDAILKVRLSTTCGSDLHFIDG